VTAPLLQPAPTCNQTPLATNIRRVMVYAMLTIAFHMLMFFWHQPKGTIGKAYGLLPAALVVALLVLMPVASLMNMYYTQNAFTRNVSTGLQLPGRCGFAGPDYVLLQGLQGAVATVLLHKLNDFRSTGMISMFYWSQDLPCVWLWQQGAVVQC